MDTQAFRSRQRIGVILRTFAKKEEDVPKRVSDLRFVLQKFVHLTCNAGVTFPFRRIDILVPTDERYPDRDCGKTGPAIRAMIEDVDMLRSGSDTSVFPIFVHDEVRGDLFCALLNHAVAEQCSDRIGWSLVLSSEAMSYCNEATLEAMVNAAGDGQTGARAVGVAIGELEQSVLEGRLANTFCMWHTKSLIKAGVFDLRAAQVQTDNRIASYMRGWDEKEGEQFYPLHGVEEVIPLARMIDLYGPCIAPVLPQGEGVKRYETPDPATQPELHARQIKKMATKTARQMALLAPRYELSWLKGGVMEQCRRF